MFISAFMTFWTAVWKDADSELVFVWPHVDWIVSIVLACLFISFIFLLVAYISIYAFVQRKSIKLVSLRLADMKWGMKDKWKVWTVIFYFQFFTIWLLLAIVVTLTDIIPTLAQAICFTVLVSISFILSFMRVFESIFWHVSNFLLELSLVVLGAITIYEEAKGPNETVGKAFVIFFTII